MKPEDLDTYFLKNSDKAIHVPDIAVKALTNGQVAEEIRGFSHLRAVKNNDGSYAGIQTVGRAEA